MNQHKPVHIYGLQDPRTGEIRYIGKTRHSPEQRLKEHVREGRNAFRAWINELSLYSLTPRIIVLETIPDGYDWRIAEIYWIKEGLRQGWSLLNQQRGGDDGTLLKFIVGASPERNTYITIFGSKELMILMGECVPALCLETHSELALLYDVLLLFKYLEGNIPSYAEQYKNFKIKLYEMVGVKVLLEEREYIKPIKGVVYSLHRKDSVYACSIRMPVKAIDLLDELAAVRQGNHRRGFEPVLMGTLQLFKEICHEIVNETI